MAAIFSANYGGMLCNGRLYTIHSTYDDDDEWVLRVIALGFSSESMIVSHFFFDFLFKL